MRMINIKLMEVHNPQRLDKEYGDIQCQLQFEYLSCGPFLSPFCENTKKLC